MKRSALRLMVIPFLLAESLSLSATQEKQAAALSAAGRFAGVWRLNTDKSSRSGIERESITIQSEESDVKFTYDWLAENGTELQWWLVTDMRGDAAKHIQVNGQPMSGESHITRLDSNTFADDTDVLKDIYKLSDDGRILTVHRTFKLSPNGKRLPEEKLVFDRVSDSP